MIGLILTIATVIFILIQWNSKVEFYKMKRGAKLLMAEVVEYKTERIEIKRNHYRTVIYPLVRVEGIESRWVKLKYQEGIFKELKIGDKCLVFFYGGELYYSFEYDKGLYGFLPTKWKFWS